MVALAVLILLTPVLYSYVAYMVKPSNSGFFAQSVEWLRGHGGRWLVNDIESLYYSLNAPKKGGPALKALPRVGFGADQGGRAYRPRAVVPAISPALPGEGVWHAAGPLVGGAPSVLSTTFRPDPEYPRLVAGVAWIDSTRTRLALYPGRYEPPSGPRGPMSVPSAARASLVATFNSGFRLEDSPGGFVANGHTYAPLINGKGTILAYRDGHVDIRTWEGGPQAGPDVLVARQNLPLILDNGRLNPNLNDGPAWGATLGNKVRVWRSGIGVDRRGNLIYAGADEQTVASLASVLQRAGAVRAIELDINYEWVSFNTYQWFGHNPAKLMPGMDRPPTRYLTPDDRDFFAVLARQPASRATHR